MGLPARHHTNCYSPTYDASPKPVPESNAKEHRDDKGRYDRMGKGHVSEIKIHVGRHDGFRRCVFHAGVIQTDQTTSKTWTDASKRTKDTPGKTRLSGRAVAAWFIANIRHLQNRRWDG